MPGIYRKLLCYEEKIVTNVELDVMCFSKRVATQTSFNLFLEMEA